MDDRKGISFTKTHAIYSWNQWRKKTWREIANLGSSVKTVVKTGAQSDAADTEYITGSPLPVPASIRNPQTLSLSGVEKYDKDSRLVTTETIMCWLGNKVTYYKRQTTDTMTSSSMIVHCPLKQACHRQDGTYIRTILVRWHLSWHPNRSQ